MSWLGVAEDADRLKMSPPSIIQCYANVWQVVPAERLVDAGPLGRRAALARRGSSGVGHQWIDGEPTAPGSTRAGLAFPRKRRDRFQAENSRAMSFRHRVIRKFHEENGWPS